MSVELLKLPSTRRGFVRRVWFLGHWCFIGMALLCLPDLVPFSRAQSAAEESDQNTQEETSEAPSFSKQSTLLPSANLQGSQTNARWKKIIESSPYSVIYKRPLSPGERVFVGVQRKADQSTLTPVAGWRMPESIDKENAWALFSVVPPPFNDPTTGQTKNLVRFYLYDVTQREDKIFPHGVEWTWRPGEQPQKPLQFFTPQLSHVPVQVDDTRLYTLPFAKTGEKTYSLIIAVTENRDQLKKILDVRETSGFNWNDWFQRIE